MDSERGPFDQLAAAMRKRGYRTVRLVAHRPSWTARAVDRLIYDRVVTLDDLSAGRDGPRDGERVVDLQWTEAMSQAIDDAALRRFPTELVARLTTRRP